MSEKGSSIGPTHSANDVPRLGRYVFWGAVVGLIGGLGALFVVSVYYGETLGLAPASCVLLGCAMTVLLSQPAGLFGAVAGALCGAVCGFVAHYVRHSLRKS
jgi:CHASE2 domain-containing sensor protein